MCWDRLIESEQGTRQAHPQPAAKRPIPSPNSATEELPEVSVVVEVAS